MKTYFSFFTIAVLSIFNGVALGQTTIVSQDFDANTSWNYESDVTYFSHQGSNTLNNVYPLPDGWNGDGFYGIIDINDASGLDYSGLSGNILGERDLDDEGDFGTSGEATTSFPSLTTNTDISTYTGVTLSFDYDVEGYNANSDEAHYELFYDGIGQGRVVLQTGSTSGDNAEGSVSVNIPDAINSIRLEIIIENNGGSGYSGFDNFELEGTMISGVFPPSSFNASATNLSTISLDWTKNSSNDDVIIARNTSNSFGTPTDGTSYSVGNTLGGAEIIYKGGATSFIDECLDGDQQYFYQIWSYDNNDDYSSELSGDATTATKELSTSGTAGSDIFFSEYIEGSSSNKYIEITNQTGTPVNLSNYTVKMYFNGSTSAGNTETLSGTLNNGETYVIANSSANLYNSEDITSSVTFFNGNDALELENNNSGVIDRIGTVGSSSNFAQDVTLVRKNSFCSGNATYTPSEWDQYSQDSQFLGSHTANCISNSPNQDVSNGGNWSSTSTWGSGTIPASGNDIAIKNSTTLDGDYTCDTLVVNSGASLTVSSGNSLTVNGILVNNGTVTIEDDGALIQTASSDNNCGSGSYTVERTGGNSSSAYDGWSTPIDGVSIHDNSGVFSSSNPCDIFAFDGSDQSWKYDFPTNYSTTCNGNGVTFTSQFLISGADGNMDAGRGYLVPGNSTATRIFSGSTINNGNYTHSLGTGMNPGGSTNWSDDYWNLIGNPYPSAIDVSDFLTANSSNLTTSAVYVWSDDGTSGSGYTESDYITVNSSGSTGAVNGSNITNGNIASTQGFFVQGTGSGGNITFTNSMRTTGNDQFRSSQSLPRFWLTLSDDRLSSQMLIAFPGDATDEFEKMYDAPRYYGQSHLNISSQLPADSTAMVIQGMEMIGADTNKEIFLLVEVDTAKEVIFDLDSIELIDEDVEIYLKDQQLDSLINIRATDYTTTLDSGKYTSRFSIILDSRLDDGGSGSDNGGQTGIEEFETNFKSFYANQAIHVQNNTSTRIEECKVYDINGKVVFYSSKNKSTYLLPGLSNGMYFVDLTFNDRKHYNTKFVIH